MLCSWCGLIFDLGKFYVTITLYRYLHVKKIPENRLFSLDKFLLCDPEMEKAIRAVFPDYIFPY